MPKFHCKVSPELKKLVIDQAHKMDMSTSAFIRYMFKQAGDYLERFLCISPDHESTYILCNGTQDLYVSLHTNEYRQMKQLHYCVNIFSMAQILRALIERFIDFIDRYGIDRLKKMIKRFSFKWQSRLARRGRVFKKLHMPYSNTRHEVLVSNDFKVILLKLHE